jgi:hypothetical protein
VAELTLLAGPPTVAGWAEEEPVAVTGRNRCAVRKKGMAGPNRGWRQNSASIEIGEIFVVPKLSDVWCRNPELVDKTKGAQDGRRPRVRCQ